MRASKTAALAAALAIAGTAGSAEAARLTPYVGQHATVMSNIHDAQQRNNAAIGHVQNSIRADQSRRQ